MRQGQAMLIGILLLTSMAAAVAVAADPASLLSGLATACPSQSVGMSRRTLALTVEDGVLTATQSILYVGDRAFHSPETFTLPLSRTRIRAAGHDLYGRPQLALSCRGEPDFCITVIGADSVAKQNTGGLFLTACDTAAGRKLKRALSRLR